MCLEDHGRNWRSGNETWQRLLSSFFTICIVLFQEDAQATACRNRIQSLRVELGMKLHGKGSEFHFRNMGHEYREAFLRAIMVFPFRFFTSTITKNKLTGKAWHKKKYMYQRAGVLALDQALEDMLEAKLIFDATSSRQFGVGNSCVFSQKAAPAITRGCSIIKEVQRMDSAQRRFGSNGGHDWRGGSCKESRLLSSHSTKGRRKSFLPCSGSKQKPRKPLVGFPGIGNTRFIENWKAAPGATLIVHLAFYR